MKDKIFKEIFRRLDRIEKKLFEKKAVTVLQKKSINKVDFSQNIRAFMKTYGRDMSGPKKYTLLTAYLVKGILNSKISAEKINKEWNKISGVMGGKIRTGTYGTRAKENDWLDSNKKGEVILKKDWQNIFS